MRPTPGWARTVLVESIVDQGQEVQPINLRCRQDIAMVGSSLLPSPLPVSTCAGRSSADPNVRAVALTPARRRQHLRRARAEHHFRRDLDLRPPRAGCRYPSTCRCAAPGCRSTSAQPPSRCRCRCGGDAARRSSGRRRGGR